jgi:hypothetical protein
MAVICNHGRAVKTNSFTPSDSYLGIIGLPLIISLHVQICHRRYWPLFFIFFFRSLATFFPYAPFNTRRLFSLFFSHTFLTSLCCSHSSHLSLLLLLFSPLCIVLILLHILALLLFFVVLCSQCFIFNTCAYMLCLQCFIFDACAYGVMLVVLHFQCHHS